MAAGSVLSDPAVVAVERPPTSLHIATATASVPPPTVVMNSPGGLGIPVVALSAYRNAEQMMAASYPGAGSAGTCCPGSGASSRCLPTAARLTPAAPRYDPSMVRPWTAHCPATRWSSKAASARVSATPARWDRCSPLGTWARYASDGDGDGVADPQNLYDSSWRPPGNASCALLVGAVMVRPRPSSNQV